MVSVVTLIRRQQRLRRKLRERAAAAAAGAPPPAPPESSSPSLRCLRRFIRAGNAADEEITDVAVAKLQEAAQNALQLQEIRIKTLKDFYGVKRLMADHGWFGTITIKRAAGMMRSRASRLRCPVTGQRCPLRLI